MNHSMRVAAVVIALAIAADAQVQRYLYRDVEPEYHVGDTLRIAYGPYMGGLIGDRIQISPNGGTDWRWCLSEQDWYGLETKDTVFFQWVVRSGIHVCDSSYKGYPAVSDSCRIRVINLLYEPEPIVTSMFRILPAVDVSPARPASIRAKPVAHAHGTFDLVGRRVAAVNQGGLVGDAGSRVFVTH